MSPSFLVKSLGSLPKSPSFPAFFRPKIRSSQDSLVDIHHLSSNDGAFCAVTCEGRMVCWGDLPVVGQPWEELTQVVEVFACEGDLAAGWEEVVEATREVSDVS